MSRKLLFLTPFLVFAIIVSLGIANISKKSQANLIKNKLLLGEKMAMPEFALRDLYNSKEILSNQDFAKSKYSLINIFSSWCVECKKEHEFLMNLSRTKSIDIYGVAWRDIDKNTKDYLEKNGNPYLKIGVDSKGLLSKLLPIEGVPETFIVDDKGQIIFYQRGPIDERISVFFSPQ
ncbi:MAG: ccmG [Rickettsiaceae bacterium]|jgi:cytochrome c biogenesis protein CcmG/thiol:disulfide interchange protein DsbE|nr:ccmG [Rickettsiaceae bacterium]